MEKNFWGSGYSLSVWGQSGHEFEVRRVREEAMVFFSVEPSTALVSTKTWETSGTSVGFTLLWTLAFLWAGKVFTNPVTSGGCRVHNWEPEKKSGKTLNGCPLEQSDLENHMSPALLDSELYMWDCSQCGAPLKYLTVVAWPWDTGTSNTGYTEEDPSCQKWKKRRFSAWE